MYWELRDVLNPIFGLASGHPVDISKYPQDPIQRGHIVDYIVDICCVVAGLGNSVHEDSLVHKSLHDRLLDLDSVRDISSMNERKFLTPVSRLFTNLTPS